MSDKPHSINKLCRELHIFLDRQAHRVRYGQPASESLTQDPETGDYFTQKHLSCGISLRAERKLGESHTTLLIIIDPDIFNFWKDGLGFLGLVYIDTYGLEITRDEDNGRWNIFLEGKELYLDTTASAPYLAAELEIRSETPGEISLVRVK